MVALTLSPETVELLCYAVVAARRCFAASFVGTWPMSSLRQRFTGIGEIGAPDDGRRAGRHPLTQLIKNETVGQLGRCGSCSPSSVFPLAVVPKCLVLGVIFAFWFFGWFKASGFYEGRYSAKAPPMPDKPGQVPSGISPSASSDGAVPCVPDQTDPRGHAAQLNAEKTSLPSRPEMLRFDPNGYSNAPLQRTSSQQLWHGKVPSGTRQDRACRDLALGSLRERLPPSASAQQHVPL